VQILDWRTKGERLLTSLWRVDDQYDVRRPGLAGRVYGRIHDRVMAQRVAGRPGPVSTPLVVSIGNLALGGTGKTPVTIAVARDLAARGYTGCVLTRGFGSVLAGPMNVTPANEGAGDEARLLAAALGACHWPVVQAKNRRAGLQYILDGGDVPQVVLLEDGHQTAGVGRACDVVILDHWRVLETGAGGRLVPETGPVFPFGPWRESARGAARADIWAVETREAVPKIGSTGSRVVTFSREMTLRPANGSAVTERDVGRAAVVSGIARPAGFERGVEALPAVAPGVVVRLSDHEPYGAMVVERIRRALSANDCRSLVTTAKDWVKLERLWPAAVPAFVVELNIVWGDGETLTDLIGERL